MLMGQVEVRRVNEGMQAAYQQRHGIFFLFFVAFLLSLPFYRFSIYGSYSLDNLLAPIACVMAVFLPRLRDSAVRSVRMRMITTVVFLYLLYVVAGLVTVLDNSELFWTRSWQGLRDGFYVLAPLLYIRDRWSWDMTKVLIIFCALSAAVSVFLVSVGIIHLELERFEDSRVGVEWLPKSIGFFSSYGDVAMLYGFSVVVLLSHKSKELCCGFSRLWFRVLAAMVLFMGVAGTQSRNVVLSTLAAIATYYFLVRFRAVAANKRTLMIILAMIGVILMSGVLIIFGGDLATDVSEWGGKNAFQTAQTRLSSYQQAIDLFVAEPAFGVSQATYAIWGGLVDGIHNMWLRILLQRGILGFLAMAALVVVATRWGLLALSTKSTLYDREAQLALAGLVAIVVAVEFYGGLSDTFRIMLSVALSSCWVVAAKSGAAERD